MCIYVIVSYRTVMFGPNEKDCLMSTTLNQCASCSLISLWYCYGLFGTGSLVEMRMESFVGVRVEVYIEKSSNFFREWLILFVENNK